MTDKEYDWEDDAKGCYLEAIRHKRAEWLVENIPGVKRARVIGRCELMQGDSLTIIPHLDPFDCIVGDPPYSSGGFTQSSITKAKGQGLRPETLRKEGWFSGDAMTAAGASFLLRELGLACFQRSTAKATLTFFTDWRVLSINAPAIESGLWRFQNLIAWDKGSAGLGSGFRAQHELAMHFSKGAPEYFSASYGNVIKAKRVPADDKYHGCEKPIDLMGSILETVCPPDGSALDPFMGSGTTLVACAKLGRKGIGIELDPDYFDIACKRVEEAYRQPDLFVDQPAPKPVQEDLDL